MPESRTPTGTVPSPHSRPPAEQRTPTVVVQDCHVTYRAYEDRRGLRHRLALHRRVYREIRALRGVSFTACAGDVIGVVGRNGSGKSTLLLALAGLLPVTRGAVYASSDPVLLGVGAALQPNLSGRRNIELGCLALGMTRDEVAERFDQIVEFSGLAAHIDLPLRTYSSGMRARLHFSVATAIEPEILLIDEALAVGDQDFKRRSQRRIRQLRRRAGTVFLVSHRLQEIRRTCNRVLWIDAGELVADGRPKVVLRAYRQSLQRRRGTRGKAARRSAEARRQAADAPQHQHAGQP